MEAHCSNVVSLHATEYQGVVLTFRLLYILEALGRFTDGFDQGPSPLLLFWRLYVRVPFLRDSDQETKLTKAKATMKRQNDDTDAFVFQVVAGICTMLIELSPYFELVFDL